MAASPRSAHDGEFQLLAKVRAMVEAGGRGRGVVVGIGDDCAVVRPSPAATGLLLTTDTMVEGVHFRASWLSPAQLGRRALRAAVSDIAAMGGRPRWVLLSLEIPRASLSERDALALVKAVAGEAARTGAALGGGNVSGGPRLAVTATVIGEAASRPLLRRAARPGDVVLVTGALGGAAAGWRALSSSGSLRAADAAAYRVPPCRVAFAAELARRGLAHAAIDVSDGLLQDLGHLAKESRVAIRVDVPKVPVHRAARRAAAPAGRANTTMPFALELALTGGEDYELAFTAKPSSVAAIERVARAARTPVTVIGRVVRGTPDVTDADGQAFALTEPGFDHLRGPHSAARPRKR